MGKFVWGTSENHREPLGKVLCSEKFQDPERGVEANRKTPVQMQCHA
jgi:hypothetical protein